MSFYVFPSEKILVIMVIFVDTNINTLLIVDYFYLFYYIFSTVCFCCDSVLIEMDTSLHI